MSEFEQAVELLSTEGKILITCHRGPDGDAFGSMVAMAALLKGRGGAEVTMYNPDLVPRHLKWMPLRKSVVHRLPKSAKFDLTIVMDCGDAKLLGEFPDKQVTGPLLVLDHHASGRPFGDVFLCDPSAASVGVLVARLADRMGWSLDGDAAVAIYVSLVSDTGWFRYSNTSAEALRLAARLVDQFGVDPWSVSERMTEQSSLGRWRLLSAALATLEPALDGKVMFMTVTEQMVRDAGASWDDSEGLVNYARSIRGVECGVLITPAKTGGVRVSVRSKAHLIDAGQVCLALGGGGHPGAAGCILAGEMKDARATVEKALAGALAAAVAGDVPA